MGIFRGQGATEYLVLLAVVLIVALVSVALLGFFPGMASDAKITQSETYWRGQARPFAIIDFVISATNTTNTSTGGLATLTFQNKEASGQYTITNITLANRQISVTTNMTSAVSFSPGQIQNINVSTATGFGTNTPGAVYEYNVTIFYTAPNMGATSLKQYGTKPLVDRYV